MCIVRVGNIGIGIGVHTVKLSTRFGIFLGDSCPSFPFSFSFIHPFIHLHLICPSYYSLAHCAYPPRIHVQASKLDAARPRDLLASLRYIITI